MSKNIKKQPFKKRFLESSHGKKSCRNCGNSRDKIGLNGLCVRCSKLLLTEEEPMDIHTKNHIISPDGAVLEKISIKTLTDFSREYHSVDKPAMRFGQAFLNKFFPSLIHANLFYEQNESKALEIIHSTYVGEDL